MWVLGGVRSCESANFYCMLPTISRDTLGCLQRLIEARKGPQRLTEAHRGTQRPTETHRGPQEATGGHRMPQEAPGAHIGL